MWDYVLPGASLDEQLIGFAAAYIALNRYIHGQDLYIVPRTLDELEQALSVPFFSTHVGPLSHLSLQTPLLC
jgi:hypothetical protein